MKVIHLEDLEAVSGGSVSGIIDGVCGALAISAAIGWLVVSTPVGIGIALGCVINAGGGSMGWW